jgi:SulP family sulfate permease
MARVWVKRSVPLVDAARTTDRRRALRDVVAGLSVATLLVPQAMAYAELAGLPAVNGLYAALGPAVAYAFLASSRQVAVGPTAAIAVLVASAVAPLAGGDPGRAVALAAALSLMVGALLLAAGLLRAGFVVNFLSEPVLAGYVTGTALVIAATQIGKVLGYDVEGHAFFDALADALRGIGDAHGLTVAVGLVSLVAMLALRRLAPRAPAILLVVAGAIVVSSLFDLRSRGVAVTGEVPNGLPAPALPDVALGDLAELALTAIGIALVAYVESMAVARAIADRRGYQVDPNQELVALGSANLLGGLFRAFPVTGSFSRSAASDAAGAVTQLAGLVTAGVVGLTLVLLTPVLENLPSATLGAVVMVAVSRLIDVHGLRRAWRVGREDAVTAWLALGGVLVLGVLKGILLAVGVSLMSLVYRASQPHRAVRGATAGDDLPGLDRVDAHVDVPGVLVYRFDAPLFFANCNRLRDDVVQLVDEASCPIRAVVVDARAITILDATAATVVHDLVERLESRGTALILAGTRPRVRDAMRTSGLSDVLDPDALAPTVPAALDLLRTT